MSESGIMKRNVLFVLPEHTWFRNIVVDSGFIAVPPYRGKNSVILRILREIHFRLNLPCKQIWFYPINRYNVFFIFECLIIPEYIKWLHKKYPDSQYIMFYINKCTVSNNPDMFRFDYLNLWTGDINDSKKYNINLCQNSGSYVKNWIVNKETAEYDIFFVGKDKGKNRLGYLLDLEKTFQDLGLKTYFHIVAERRYDRYRNPHYKKFLSYRECLNYLGKSKAILYLGFGSQECITIRVQESLIHKVKLVTDCLWLKKYDFYHPQNIFILGEDKIENLPDFLNSPYVDIDASILKHIYFEDLVKEIISQSRT